MQKAQQLHCPSRQVRVAVRPQITFSDFKLKMKDLILFTIDEMEFTPHLLEPLLSSSDVRIKAAFVSKSIFSFKKLWRKKYFFLRNGYPFCISRSDLFRFAMSKFRSKSTRHHDERNMVEFLSARGIPTEFISEIRTESTRSRLRDLDADIFLLCPFDKIAGPKFISIPKLGAFNVHLGKLPEYRGGLSSFWVLRFGDETAGASLHRVSEEIDTGELTHEIRFKHNATSMRELMHETVRNAGEMVKEGILKIAAQSEDAVDISGRESNYFLYPQKEDFTKFYSRGYRLL